MARRYYNLPPLTTLAAFEAAARHLSFKNAAQELSVTPGAVSHQIKALEAELGVSLFRRGHRAVELTEEAEQLYETVASAFAKISQRLQSVRERNANDVVTVGSTSAVASLWLSQSVVRFWQEYPDITVNQVVVDRSFRSVPELDLYIRYGQETGGRFEQVELYRDCLVPVGNKDMADTLTGCSLAELASQRLIHLESEDRTWTSWSDWFQQLGYDGPIANGIRVNNYAIALQVAQDGAGLALGWQRLIRPLLKTRALIPIGPTVLSAPHRFHAVCPREDGISGGAKLLRDWLVKEVKSQTD
ncbi:transcriptional regulator, LysR family protein [Pseudovibrio sp. FO-BEG1]|uniref:LysR substrate-binding domain-containing protein n=1 Tax=Pseudovibrio sp. (strain FO-BEG1) TaxID=911045 RepID=UPI000238D20D|nr:LysR substrate-binding domain-containing protein [Pseudovibrio sp. FO-BEG1]AEV38679.1 transcriptional regulator, LysR family protein [Pseudovibrio sp. FO-BEG1]